MPDQRRTTLKDIATACGVSVMTVSRVLRKQLHVKAAVREQVEAAAARLGYRPDPALAALIRHRNKGRGSKASGEQLVLLVPEEARFGWGTFPIMTELEADMETEADRLGYRMRRSALPSNGHDLEPALRKLYNRGVRGLMLAPSLDISRVPRELWEEFVVVTLEPGTHSVPFHAIRNDFFQMGECAVEAFHRMGYRRIAYVAGPMDAHTHFRAVGALAACRERLDGLETDVFRAPEWGSRPPDGYFAWIRKFRPEALIAMSTWFRQWHTEWEAGDKPAIEFAQLNRPRWDHSIHGVCTAPGTHGKAVIQRLHQLLLDDERGIPESRTVLRIDGYWQAREG